MYTRVQWAKQIYLSAAPIFCAGYLGIHGFRDHPISRALYVKRSAIQPSDSLRHLVDSEFDLLEDVNHPIANITLTDDAEPHVYGGFFLKFGTEIQFPTNVSWVDVEYARRLGAHVELDLGVEKNRKKLEMDSDVANDLIARMMLSDNAKRFIVQRELQLANNGVFFCIPMVAWMSLVGMFYPVMTSIAPALGIIPSAVSCLGFVFVSFRLFLERFNSFVTKNADETTAKMGAPYDLGGKEYLESLLATNRVLRKVMGKDGEAKISKSGDFIGAPVTITDRMKAIDKIIETNKLTAVTQLNE